MEARADGGDFGGGAHGGDGAQPPPNVDSRIDDEEEAPPPDDAAADAPQGEASDDGGPHSPPPQLLHEHHDVDRTDDGDGECAPPPQLAAGDEDDEQPERSYDDDADGHALSDGGPQHDGDGEEEEAMPGIDNDEAEEPAGDYGDGYEEAPDLQQQHGADDADDAQADVAGAVAEAAARAILKQEQEAAGASHSDLYDAQYDSGEEEAAAPALQDDGALEEEPAAAAATTSHRRVPHPYYGSDYDSDQPLMPPKRKRGRPRRILDDGPPTQVRTEPIVKKPRRPKAADAAHRKKLAGAPRRPAGARGRNKRAIRHLYADDWSDEEEAELAGLLYATKATTAAGKRGIRPAGPTSHYSIIPVAPASKADRVCPVCGRGPFKDWLRYHRHAVQHAPSRGRPYGCDRCGHSFFRSRGQLVHHQKMLCTNGGEGGLEDGEQTKKRVPAAESTAAAAAGEEHVEPAKAKPVSSARKAAAARPSPLTRLLMKSGSSVRAAAVAAKQQNDAVLMPEIKRIQSQQRLMIRAGRKGRLATDVCPMCGRYFRDRDEHMRMHTADPSRPYQCSLCKMAYFETVRSAQRHLFWCSGGRRKKRCRGEVAEQREQAIRDGGCAATGTMVTMPAEQQQSAPTLSRAPMTADELMNSVLSLSGIGPAAAAAAPGLSAPQHILNVTDLPAGLADGDDDGAPDDRSSPPQLTPMVPPAQVAGVHSPRASGGGGGAQSRRKRDRHAVHAMYDQQQPTMVQQHRPMQAGSSCSSVPPPHMSPAPQQQHMSHMGTPQPQQQQQLGQHIVVSAGHGAHASSSSLHNVNVAGGGLAPAAAGNYGVHLQHLQQGVQQLQQAAAVYSVGVGSMQFTPLNMHNVMSFDPTALWPGSTVAPAPSSSAYASAAANTAVSMVQAQSGQQQQVQTTVHSGVGGNQQPQQPQQQAAHRLSAATFICDLCERAQFADPQALNKHKELCGLPRLMAGKH